MKLYKPEVAPSIVCVLQGKPGIYNPNLKMKRVV